MRCYLNLQNDKYSYGVSRLFALLCRAVLVTVTLASLCVNSEAQDLLSRADTVTVVDDGCDIDHLAPCFKRIAQDEVGMTRSIFHIQRSSLPAILGIAAATGVSLKFDKQMSQTLTNLPMSRNALGREADLAGVYGPFGIGGLLYVAGSVLDKPRVRETGILATEAMVDAALMGKALKFVTNRQAPGSGPNSFNFYTPGPHGGSMPSSHSLNAWSFARVVAGQSHSKWVSVLAYTVATSVSMSRALTGAHSVSDVIVGSALGYGIGEYVLRKRSTERRIADYRVASRRGTLATLQKHEGLLQPEEPLKLEALIETAEVAVYKDEVQPNYPELSAGGDAY
jgi:membrane-associated phospholipid phosphatase